MEKILQLANILDGQPRDHVPTTRTTEDPWVQMLASVIDDHDAEVTMMVGRPFEDIATIAARAGKQPEEIQDDLHRCAMKGTLLEAEIDGVLKYERCPWAPGIFEHLILTKDLPVETRKMVGKLFDQIGSMSSRTYPNIPIGRFEFRTLPVGKAIKAEAKIATHEEIETYLNQSDYYSVADCACRTSKKLIGEACEHPIEGMCIQIGPEADYYVRSGRGRRVTREEVEEVLRKAERAGCVHQYFNNEGLNKTTFICSCCGCSCAGLRVINLVRTPDAFRSNFVADVDPDKCVGCGACVEVCNMNAVKLGAALCKVDQTPVLEAHPSDTEWGPEHWNPDWKKRVMVNEYGTSPCKTKCPAHISVQGYIKKAREGKYADALKIIKRENPLPAVCGRICPHYCEEECTRCKVDEAIAIDDIKRFIADKELASEHRFIPTVYEHYDEKIAVIGAGPAGISCAYYLAAEGYPVTVFEKDDVLGGMLRKGIPSFRLEKDVVEAEIDVLRQLGVTFQTGVEVGKDVTLQQLREQGYKAFFLAIGAQKGTMLRIDGVEAEGVLSGVDFLRSVSVGAMKELPGKTVVIGGGNVAIDVARTAVRMGAEKVDLFCLESKAEMPALEEEQLEATEEGVTLNNSWGPKRILSENGRVTGVEFMRCLSVFNEEHRFAPKYDENDTVVIPCDHVLMSVGQTMDWGGLLEGSKMQLTPRKTLVVKELSYQTDEPDVFAGGDAVSGPKFAIDAIAMGKSGAISIHRFVRGRSLTLRREREYSPFDKNSVDFAGFDRVPRQKAAHVNPDAAKKSWHDERKPLTEEQVRKEAQRCLGCGIAIVDPYMCIGCGICSTHCEFDAMKLRKNRDVTPALTNEERLADVAKYAKERHERLAAKKG